MLIASPNLCLDRTEFLAELVPGGVMRALEVQVTAGGKGVNIARVLRAYQRPATLVTLVAAKDRDRLLGLLAGEGIDVLAVDRPGDARIAMIMIERPGGRITVVNEPGSPLPAASWDEFRAAVERALPGRAALACSGSLPPGAPEDGYGELVELAHRAGVPALVDSAPRWLRASLSSRPDLVAPNVQEAEAAISGASASVLLDADTDVCRRAVAAASTLCVLGARAAAVTAGADGVALVEAESAQARWVPTVTADVVSAVGAGDSFLAGVMLELEATAAGAPVDWAAAVLRASATASASCEQLLAGDVDPLRAAEFLGLVRERAAEQPPFPRPA